MPGTILVADDSPTIQRRASGILTAEGHDVVTVANGVAAVKKLASVKPLLVLADVSMPGRDGYEVCQIIKQAPETKHVPVFLIFSDLEPFDQARGAQVGANGSIKKPFVQDELLEIVRKLIQEAQPATAPAPPPPAAEMPSPAAAEPEESEEAVKPEPTPSISAVPEGVAFASDIPTVEAEPASHAITAAEAESVVESAGIERFGSGFDAPQAESSVPELVEEPIASSEEPHDHPHPHDHAAIFQPPEEIAEPILTDQTESEQPTIESLLAQQQDEAVAPPVEVPPRRETFAPESPQDREAIAEEPVVGTGENLLPEPEAKVEEAQSAPEVSELASQPETTAVEPSPEPSVPPPPAATALTRDQVHRIVRQVVVRMSPPALPSSTIEDIATHLTEEILSSQ